MTTVDELLEVAVDLTRMAGEVTLQWFGKRGLEVDTKADGSPVTAADRAAERLIREQLAIRFPEDAVIGEEYPDSAGTTGRTWLIDPIDGTKSFMRGVPLYATLVSVIDDDGPAVGVVGVPALEEMVWAGRNLGCFHDGGPARVSQVDRVEGACLTTSGLDYWAESEPAAVLESGALVRTWGDGYGYVLVATGRADAMIDPGLSRWDVAPMNVVIPEAGGTITDFHGGALPPEGNVVASNGLIHREVLDLLAPR